MLRRELIFTMLAIHDPCIWSVILNKVYTMMTRTEQRSNLLAASRRLFDLTVVFESGSAVDMLPSVVKTRGCRYSSTCIPSGAGNPLLIRMPCNQ